MIKLSKIIKEIQDEVKFIMPNAEYEWEEAERYPNIFPDKKSWLDAFKMGKIESIDCSMNLTNTDMCDGDLDDLEPEKVQRAMQSLRKGVVELPIFLKNRDKYELVGGNTRLTALATHGIPAKAWVIDLDKL